MKKEGFYIKTRSGKPTVQSFRITDVSLTEPGFLMDILFPSTVQIIKYRYIMTGFY